MIPLTMSDVLPFTGVFTDADAAVGVEAVEEGVVGGVEAVELICILICLHI